VSKKQTLKVVKPEPETPLSSTDVQELNLPKLRDAMLKGVYGLQAALWTQAGYEYQHIEKMRGVIDKIENGIFSEESLKELSLSGQVKLYSILSHNMTTSLQFMSNLHGNITTAIDSINQIEKMKMEVAPTSTGKKDNLVEELKVLIANKIKEKVEKGKGKK